MRLQAVATSSMRGKKSQASIELIIAIAVILAVFILSSVLAGSRSLEVNEFSNLMKAKNDCRLIANTAESVFLQGEGSYANITLKSDASTSFTIISNSRHISVNTGARETSCNSHLNNLLNANNQSYFIIQGGTTIRILNLNNSVYLL